MKNLFAYFWRIGQRDRGAVNADPLEIQLEGLNKQIVGSFINQGLIYQRKPSTKVDKEVIKTCDIIVPFHDNGTEQLAEGDLFQPGSRKAIRTENLVEEIGESSQLPETVQRRFPAALK